LEKTKVGIGAYFHRSKEDEEMLQVKVSVYSLSVSVESHAGLAVIGERSVLDRNIYRKINLKIMYPFEFLHSI